MESALSNDSYKLSVDVHRKVVNFEVGDLVMTRIRPERLLKTPSKTFKLIPWHLTKSFENRDLLHMHLISLPIWV